jgi:hypothetical protein
MATARERSNANYDSALTCIEATQGLPLFKKDVVANQIALAQTRATLALVAAVQDLADIVKEGQK